MERPSACVNHPDFILEDVGSHWFLDKELQWGAVGERSGRRTACHEAVITWASAGGKASLGVWSQLSVTFLSACSTYAPVKSFLRVDKEKVSFLLPTSMEIVQA